MNDTRKWISTRYILPHEGQKVYYFCDTLGIFRGEFHIDKSSIGNPNKFSSNHGVVDADDIQYWMPYDHSLRDMIPLPPDYKKVDIRNQQSIMNSGLDIHYDEIEIPQEYKEFSFNYILSGEIQ